MPVMLAVRGRRPAAAARGRSQSGEGLEPLASAVRGLLPAWVEADPVRARASDALGLRPVADRLADRLLPGISTQTTRARYFTCLSWARGDAGERHDEREIHRREAALALAEARLSLASAAHAASCRFVGSRRLGLLALDRVPASPRVLYRVPAWRGYRASMVDLGLVAEGAEFALTDEGRRAARAFRAAVRPGRAGRELPPRACLSRPSRAEKTLLRERLGFSLRGRLDGQDPDPRARRALVLRELRALGPGRAPGLTPAAVLAACEMRRRGGGEVLDVLRLAALWERVGLGLGALFALWARAHASGRGSRLERLVERLARRRHAVPSLGEVHVAGKAGEAARAFDEEGAVAAALGSLGRASRAHDALLRGEAEALDDTAFALARALLACGSGGREAPARALHALLERHLQTKGDDAWIVESGTGELALGPGAHEGRALPRVVRPHAYRLEALASLARDLGSL